MNATAQPNNLNVISLAGIIANCWLNKEFKNKLIADPKKILSKHNIEFPADVNIKVLVDSPNLIHIILANEPLEDRLSIDTLPENPTFLQVYRYIYEKGRTDRAFRHRFLVMPTKTFRELGFSLPENVHIAGYESTEHTRYFVIPTAPKATLSTVIQNEMTMLSMTDPFCDGK